MEQIAEAVAEEEIVAVVVEQTVVVVAEAQTAVAVVVGCSGKQAEVAVEAEDELEEDQSDHLGHHLVRNLPKQFVPWSTETEELAEAVEGTEVVVAVDFAAQIVVVAVVEAQTVVVVVEAGVQTEAGFG